MRIRREYCAAAALAAVLSAPVFAQSAADDPILRAMRDEMERSRQLRVAGLEDKPYFIEYSIEQAEFVNIFAQLGALVGSTRNRALVPQVTVRVGSYEFDNTNHTSSGQSSGPRLDQWPLENNYAVIRHNLWLATDRAYKGALEAMARKRSSLRDAASPEKMPDFAKAEPKQAILGVNAGSFNETEWNVRAKDLSSIFFSYPEIELSGVDLSAYIGTSYYVNSEGTQLRYPELLFNAKAHARAQAADGAFVHDMHGFPATDFSRIPGNDELKRGVEEVAGNVRTLLKAPRGDSYSGPVLFEPQAAAQLMAQLLGDNLRLPRRPVADPGRPNPVAASELESKLGSRIVPEWIDVTDDPTLTEHQGRPLIGSYAFDMEGVAGRAVPVIQKGVLKEFLLTRQPVSTFSASNGHARLPGPFGARAAAVSNLIVKAAEAKPMAGLKAQLIEMVKKSGKPYGMMVRKLDYPSSANLSELRSLAEGSRGGSRPISPPVLAYRVYPDGREELVRDLRFRGLTVRALRDILGASNETAVFNYVNNGALLASIGFGGFVAPASVVSPALLFEEVEFERPQDELPKRPVVPAPPLEGKPAS